MPLTISNTTGNGQTTPLIQASIQLPDSGTSALIVGTVDMVGLATVSITGSPLTIPAAPGSGSIYWMIEVNGTTGVATVQQSTVAMPVADPGNIIIFQQTLVSGNSNDALVPTDVTPSF